MISGSPLVGAGEAAARPFARATSLDRCMALLSSPIIVRQHGHAMSSEPKMFPLLPVGFAPTGNQSMRFQDPPGCFGSYVVGAMRTLAYEYAEWVSQEITASQFSPFRRAVSMISETLRIPRNSTRQDQSRDQCPSAPVWTREYNVHTVLCQRLW